MQASGALAASMGDLGLLCAWLLTAIVLVVLVYFVLTLIFSAKLRWQLLRRIAQVLLVVLLFYLIAQPADRHARAAAASAAGSRHPPPPPAARVASHCPPSSPILAVARAVSALLAGLLIGGIWLFWRRSRARPPPAHGARTSGAGELQAGAS